MDPIRPLPGKGPSPINLPGLALLLSGYPDRSAAKSLLTGFQEGSRIPSPLPTGVGGWDG